MILIYNEIAAKETGIKVSPYKDLRQRGMTIINFDPLPGDGKLIISVDDLVGILPDYIEVSKYSK